MGYWIGKGKWAFSSEEKAEFRQKKREEFQAKVDHNRKTYLSQTNLKSFLTPKQIEEYFKVPDRTTTLYSGAYVNQYDYKKVLSKLKKYKMTVKIKKGFEDIRIEEVKKFVRLQNSQLLVDKLDTKLPPKGTIKEKPKKI